MRGGRCEGLSRVPWLLLVVLLGWLVVRTPMPLLLLLLVVELVAAVALLPLLLLCVSMLLTRRHAAARMPRRLVRIARRGGARLSFGCRVVLGAVDQAP